MTKTDAIYTRQSVDRPDSISVESQTELCRREVQDNDYRVYTDRGYSGKNTDRPAMQRLIRDIKEGKIKRVIVYRLDRISRSVLDFSQLIAVFQEYQVDFVSTMEKFDTATPIGKAMLMIVMVFAQLERETIQQRVTDAYHSRSRRGFYMGGRVPYGFELAETTLDGIPTKMYLAKETEARTVGLIFSLYAKPQVSLNDVAHHLNENGILKPDGKLFTASRIREIIVNPVYVRADYPVYDFFRKQGCHIINPPEDFIGTNGAYCYTGEDAGRKTISLEGQTLVLAPHEGIVDSALWLSCRKKCLVRTKTAKPVKATATWLAGKIKCGHCGYALRLKICHCKTKEDNRYYLCTRKQHAEKCPFGSLDADAVDACILAEIRKKTAALGPLRKREETGHDAKTTALRISLDKLNQEIDALIRKLPEANPAVTEYINNRISTLDKEKKNIRDTLIYLRKNHRKDTGKIENCMRHWDYLTIDDKIAVVDCLIVSVSATEEALEITWRI